VALLARNIAPLYFKLEKYTRPPYAHRDFEPLWLDFTETSGIFSSPGDSKLTPDGLSFQ